MGRSGTVSPELHRGEVWWADAPGDKIRPVLVLTREAFVPRLSSVLVAPVTTTVRGIPTELLLGTTDGMPRVCAANFDNLASVHRARFRSLITALNQARLPEICAPYRFAAGC